MSDYELSKFVLEALKDKVNCIFCGKEISSNQRIKYHVERKHYKMTQEMVTDIKKLIEMKRKESPVFIK